ncbi:MAG TPA: ElyC/SanA/YdcF family protein [Verrucomicrobiae bacterium]|nr:ElyC/SanA/YdcF family protein [Verrucomicrobiae bacterium]
MDKSPLKATECRWSLWKRRECTIPTLWGCVVLLLVAVSLIAFGIRVAHPFLTVNDPVPSNILVVEGWVPDCAAARVLSEFRQGHCNKILVTGGPITAGINLCGYTNWADFGAAALLRLGLGTNSVEAVPAERVVKDRTYASALALKAWLRRHRIGDTSFNLLTMADHSRRSRLLFCKAMGPAYRVGVISVEDNGYDPNRWWKSSEGVRTVVGEMIAYGYARFLFWPSEPSEQSDATNP